MTIINKNTPKKKLNKSLTILLIISLGILLILGVFIAYEMISSTKASPVSTITPPEEKHFGWLEEEGKWYFYDKKTGEKHSGWLMDEGHQYYLDPDTKERATGLVQITNEKWYYFDKDGKLYKDQVVNGYIVNKYGFIVDRVLTEGEQQSRLTKLQENIDTISSKYGADGVSVALIENGKVTDAFAYGHAQKSSSSTTKVTVPMTTDTKIRIASISKVISSMIGFQMMEKGLVDLDASIGDYWGFPVRNSAYPDHTISLRSIYTHTSSIADLSAYNQIEEKLRQNAVFRNTQPLHPASCSYCNFAFAVSGATLEKAGGKIIDDLADEAFFNDLGIDAAFASGRLGDKSLMAELYYADGSIARSLNTLNNDAGTDIPGKNGSYVVGGLCISAKDLAKLVCILANDGTYEDKQYLSPESVELMETPFCKTDYHGVEVTQCMPLKYNINIYGQRSLYFHTGSAYGVYALITYNPDTRNGVAVVTTGASGAQDEYGIYAICGDISEMLYTSLKQDWKTTLSPMDEMLLGIKSE